MKTTLRTLTLFILLGHLTSAHFLSLFRGPNCDGQYYEVHDYAFANFCTGVGLGSPDPAGCDSSSISVFPDCNRSNAPVTLVVDQCVRLPWPNTPQQDCEAMRSCIQKSVVAYPTPKPLLLNCRVFRYAPQWCVGNVRPGRTYA
jgi:hypothetical protein